MPSKRSKNDVEVADRVEVKFVLGVQLLGDVFRDHRRDRRVAREPAAGRVWRAAGSPVAAALPAAFRKAGHVRVLEGQLAGLRVAARDFEHVGEPRRVHPGVSGWAP